MHDRGWRQGIPIEDVLHAIPGHAPLSAAARERLAPVANDPIAEAAETLAVPRQTVVAAVAPDDPREVLLLLVERSMPIGLAPCC